MFNFDISHYWKVKKVKEKTFLCLRTDSFVYVLFYVLQAIEILTGCYILVQVFQLFYFMC